MRAKPQLLLADDEISFRTMVAHALKDDGFEITEVSNGEEAIKAARKCTFDIAILDVRMPIIDGIEVLKTIKKESPSTDCIMLTGFQDFQLAVDAIKSGAKEFLTKPITMVELVNRVKTVLRAHIAELQIKELQSEFTSKLLHDLLTPLHTLNSAVNFLESGMAGPVTDQQKKICQSIENTIKTIDGMLNDMIDLSLFESGRVDIECFPTNLDELVTTACKQFMPRANGKNIDLRCKINDNIPTIEVDPNRIGQVINNLLENAITYTPAGGSIEVGLSVTNKMVGSDTKEFVEISVADSGVGISKEELPHIFDKYKDFITGKSSEKNYLELGLTICRSIVDAHRGSMSAESELGKGSVFKFSIPTYTMT